MKLKNKDIGAKVIVRELTTEINPKVKWKKAKNLSGVIVPMKDEYEHYWHTCDGGYGHATKHLIKNDCYPNYAVKLDNDVVDIEGNNIIVVREHDIKFLEFLPETYKPITNAQYKKALKVIEKYKYEQTLK